MTGRPEKATPENGKAGNETGITEVEVTTESKENNMEEDSKKTVRNNSFSLIFGLHLAFLNNRHVWLFTSC
jgi:hypothetical protein